VVISPDGSTVYATNSHSGTVVSMDTATAQITHSATTGVEPRSMAISRDGKALYVVNYESSTVTKLRASDLTKLDEEPTDYHPIGITYEPTTNSVWVACYGGSILVFSDTTPAG
jgi:YVTN family beta-propeller protein